MGRDQRRRGSRPGIAPLGRPTAADIWVIGWDRRDSDIPLVGHYDGKAWSIVPPGDALPPGRSLHYSPNGVPADASGLWIIANVSDDTSRTTKPLLVRCTGDRWRTERVTAVTGPWRETFAPIPGGRGGHWFLGSRPVAPALLSVLIPGESRGYFTYGSAAAEWPEPGPPATAVWTAAGWGVDFLPVAPALLALWLPRRFPVPGACVSAVALLFSALTIVIPYTTVCGLGRDVAATVLGVIGSRAGARLRG